MTLRVLLMLALVPFITVGTRAQDASSAYVVTYIEVAPSSKNHAARLLRDLDAVSRKEAGNLRFEIMQRIDRPHHFAVVEAWKDQKALDAHAAATSTKQFRSQLEPLLSAPYDERPHGALAVAPGGKIGRRAVFAVTHVDIIPPKKDDGIAMSKNLADPSRKDAGNIRYEVLQQLSRPNHMTLVEIWNGERALEAHENAPHMKKYRDALLPMSGSLYDQRLYRLLR